MSAVKISKNSRENAWEDCTSEKGVFGKVFDSGLRQSLFLPGLSALSTKLITVQRALSCLVCLFLPTEHPTSPSLARILSFLLPLFLFLPRPLRRRFFSLAPSFFTPASSRSLHQPFAEWRALRRARQVSFGLSAREEPAPFRSSSSPLLGSVAGRVLDNRSSPTESRGEIPRVHLPYPVPPRRVEPR